MKRVVFVALRFNQYRVDFYNLLRESLKEHNIQLLIIHGKSKNTPKKDETELDWGITIPTVTIKAGKGELYWQPCLKYLKRGDLVIVQQANKLILNYLLILFRKLFNVKMAYWGHGLNMQKDKYSFENRFKRKLIRRTDWWFAYTRKVKDLIVENGFPSHKVTVVENAIDTVKLQKALENTKDEEVVALKSELGITSRNVGIYCGGIYKEKRIEFLIRAADLIREKTPDFELIVIGSGPDLPLIKAAAETRKWIHYAGVKFHEEKVPYFKAASVFLMPGLVGLAILDSFALQTPMFTTDYPYHSPEIEYLKNGYNGVMTENDLDKYAESVNNAFADQEFLKKLKEGCKNSTPLYSNEKMVQNFKEGIVSCLNA